MQAIKQRDSPQQYSSEMASPERHSESSVDTDSDGGSSTHGDNVNSSLGRAAGEQMYQSLDPGDARKVSLDIFEWFCYQMLKTESVSRRAFLVNELRYLVRTLIRYQHAHGRLYNYTMIANIIARVCGRHAYVIPDSEKQDDANHHLEDCLVDFSPKMWQKVMIQFESLRESLVRNDAMDIILPAKNANGKEGLAEEEVTFDEDDRADEELDTHDEFTKRYENMKDLMHFHTCLSHLQPQMATAIQKGSREGAESVVIPHENIVAFAESIDEQFGNEENRYAEILESFLETNEKMSRSTRQGGLHLKSFQAIKRIYTANKRLFDLESFQHRFLVLIRNWADLALPVPQLSKLGYGSTADDKNVKREPMAALPGGKENVRETGARIAEPSMSDASPAPKQRQRGKAISMLCQQGDSRKPSPKKTQPTATTSFNDDDNLFENNAAGDDLESSSEEEVEEKRETLQRKRKSFMKKVKDPMDAIVAKAQAARTRKRGEDSGSDGDSSEGGGKRKAAETPTFRKKTKKAYQLTFEDSESEESEGGIKLSEVPTKYKSPARKVQSPKPIQVRSKSPAVQKRKKFTEREDGAIKLGVRRFGEGHWAHIKAYYCEELIDRSSVQIKDRCRTLKKLNLI